jgi:2-amino-4-hydroxy-6-hydroxymethyldihydropteridine diphosphokinase
VKAYLSLGSNVGDRFANLNSAIEQLRHREQVMAVSSFYETEPVEFTDQPWFVNCVVKIETQRTAQELLQEILSIEKNMGRNRLQPKGPRNIDIDILLMEDTILDTPEVTIPHPAMAQRRFVLEPLAEIDPGVMHPVIMKKAAELLDELPRGQSVRKVP